MEAWKQHYKPILIGERLVILPAWMDSPDPNRVAIKIDPGMAFGTGTHPTTQLCLELMESYFDQLSTLAPRAHRPGWSVPGSAGFENRKHLHLAHTAPVGRCRGVQVSKIVIDVGCGSGILSIAAIKLGAKKVLGVDIDAASIKNAQENAETNKVGKEIILGVGSVAEILNGQFPFKNAPLVVANILAPVIIRLFDAGMADLIEAVGTIILSGILQEQEQGVIEAAQVNGLRLSQRRQMGDWVALAMNR